MIPESSIVQARFNRHAKTYDENTPVQETLGESLLAGIPGEFAPQRILDLGCGTGRLAVSMQQRWPQASIVGVDFAPEMLRRARCQAPRANFYEGDLCEFLRLQPDGAYDLVISNASLQWVVHQADLFRQIRRVTKHGHIAFSSFGPQTFCELRTILAAHVPTHAHLLPLPSPGQWQAQVDGELRVRRDRVMHHYESVRAFLRVLQQSGTSYSTARRALSVGALRRIESGYVAKFAEEAGIPVTYELLCCYSAF